MTSYIKFFEDFLQKKEVQEVQRNQKDEVNKVNSANTEDNDDENEQSSTTETVPSPKPEKTPSPSPTPTKKMEHSYMRESNARPMAELTNGLPPARTILVRRRPQCGACHTHPPDEHEFDESNQAVVPAYNEIGAKEAMNECARIAKYVKNLNADDEDWTARVNQFGWSATQKTLFEKVVKILDDDQLGRLANQNRQHEAMQRRVLVDKSAVRMRKLLASIAWDTRLSQWLHGFLMECLPATYMASYLDVLQTLKTKVPILMDKMLFGRPMNISQELLAPVMKKKWEPQFTTKPHKLQQNAVIVALPSMPTSGAIPNRLQKWYQQLASIAQIVQITLPMINNHTNTQPLEQLAEQIVSLTRVKIQELRNESPMRSIILIGFNAGAALALQVAMSESIACVICMGFAYNTMKGVRGTPEDRILDLKVPILFVIGQNSQRTSQEEIEFLREKMQSESSLVVVGGADDFLRCPKSRRQIENVTQAMVDAMVVDEVFEFIKRILTNPPGPRVPTAVTGINNQKSNLRTIGVAGEKGTLAMQRKRKLDAADSEIPTKTKLGVGRPRTRPLPTGITVTQQKSKQVSNAAAANKAQSTLVANTANNDLNLAMQTLLGDSGDEHDEMLDSPTSATTKVKKPVTNYELVSPPKAGLLKTPTVIGGGGTKIKMIPSNQFLQIKPQQMQTQSKIYTIKTTSPTVVGGGGASSSSTLQSNSIGSIVRTTPSIIASGQQQIFTLKSPNGKTTQFVTAGPANTQQKYTVVKNTLGGTMLQLTTAKNVAAAAAAAATTSHGADDGGDEDASNDNRLDLSNIIDMPILFADSEGNFTETQQQTESKPKMIVNKPSTSSGVGQLIISQKIIKEANTQSTTIGTTKGGAYVISKPGGGIVSSNIISNQQLQTLTNRTGTTPNTNKVVYINRNTMKPCPNIISRTPGSAAQNFGKYAKVMVSNSQLKTSPLLTRPGVQITPTVGASTSAAAHINLQNFKSSLNLTGSAATTRATVGGSIISLAGKPLQIVNKSSIVAGGISAPTTSNVNSDKPTIIRNIVVKPANLKQIPAHLSGQLLNRNLTVRKLVNIVPGGGIVSASAATTTNTNTTEAGGSSAGAMHSTPKIIKLNPINKHVD